MIPVLRYYVSLLCFLPGGLLALFFCGVAHLATSPSLWTLFGRLVEALDWLMGWGLAAVLAAVAFLLLAGAIPPLRPWGSGVMALLSAAALVAILFLPPEGPGWDALPFAAGLGLAMAGFGSLVLQRGQVLVSEKDGPWPTGQDS